MIFSFLSILKKQQLLTGLFFCACTFPFFGHTQQKFPQSWTGQWQGTLQWFQAGKPDPQLVPMQLIIAKGDSSAFTWQLKYGEAGADNRPYLLLPRDTSGVKWVIDERNGIALEQYFVGNRLTGVFTVMNNTLLNSYQLLGDSLVVEFHSYSKEPISKTGLGTEDSPHVMSYRVGGYQRAVLRRKP